jgi:hypothetical protein
VRGLDARLVHRALDRVGQRDVGDISLDRRSAGVPGQRRGQDVVPAMQGGKDELPRAPRVGEAV